MTPMEQGLRVVGTVEFGGLSNPLSKSRIKNLVDNAKFLLDGLLPDHHDDEWLGFRPTLPDYLPVIGPSKIIIMLIFFWSSSFGMDFSCYIWEDNF